MAPWHFHFAGLLHDKVCLGENVPQDPACRGSLCSPTQSTYMAFTHMLPGASRRRVVPPSLPRFHPLLLMCQQTRESSGYQPDGCPCLPGICGPSRMGVRFIRKSKDCKHEPKQENEANVDLARNAKPCSLPRASALPLIYQYWQSQKAHLRSRAPDPFQLNGCC